MQAQPNVDVLRIVDEIKFVIAVGSAFWAAFSVYSGIKELLTQTREDVKTLKDEVSSQTATIVKVTESNTQEIKGLRDDMKMIIGALMTPSRTRSARR